MIKVIYAQEEIKDLGCCNSILFLAGPTPRDKETKSWRPKFLEELLKVGFQGTVLIPEMRNPEDWKVNFAYDKQIEWEHKGMEIATDIIFWIPRELEKMPAFTTNIEFGYWLAKDLDKMIVGFPEGTPKNDYIKYQCKKNGIPLFKDMKSLVEYL